MQHFKKILKLALDPPQSLTNLGFVTLYFVIAIIPGVLLIGVAFLFEIYEDINVKIELPEIGLAITSIFLAPWLETLVFFSPASWFLTGLSGLKRWSKLLVIALIFTTFHYFWGVRNILVAPLIFWAGLIMAYAYETGSRSGRGSIKLTAYIHTLYNVLFVFLIYIVYALTQIALPTTIKILIFISVALILMAILYLTASKIAARHQLCNDDISADKTCP